VPPRPPRRQGPGGEEGLVFGVHPVLETLKTRPGAIAEILSTRALEGGGPPGEIARRAREAGVPVRRVRRAELEHLAGDRGHQGLAARVRPEASALPRVDDPLELVDAANAAGRAPLLLVLDGVQDPGNLGALVRSAHALGADGVVIPKDRATEMTPAAVKASAGAAAHCPVVRVVNLVRTLRDLKEAGLWVVGADPGEGADDLDRLDLSGPLAVVVGAEGPGIRRLVLEACDLRARIPMPAPIGSLNASVAGGIVLYEVRRQRRAKEDAPAG